MEPTQPAATQVTGVEVPGGTLGVERITSATEPVLAIHGISSQRRLWNWLRGEDPGVSLIAPDLRGRGDSVAVEGTSSIARHAADMIAVLDHFGLDAAHVCGMSMGGFVAVDLATSYPARVKSLILVDGGYPMAPPPGLTAETLPAVFASRLARLDRDWASLGEYAAFFAQGTAPLLDPADPLLLDYLAHDLDGHRVRLNAAALIADGTDIFFGPSRQQKWDQLRTPTRLLTAQWSTGPGSDPAYPPGSVKGPAGHEETLVTVLPLPGADHAASIMSRAGGKATASLIAEAMA
jgi:pimeloyl-ACP methyl ester carboxylesterase